MKLMDLEEGVRIAKIAKVRERISDGEQEFDNPEDAMEDMEERPEEEMSGVEANQSLISSAASFMISSILKCPPFYPQTAGPFPTPAAFTP